MASNRRALVTGVTGFIAQHVTAQLLSEGWEVRGTLRDPKRSEEVRTALKPLAPEALDRLSFVRATLENDAGWAEAMAGVDAVLHVASPIPLTQPRDPNELIKPARDGALRVLTAAKAAKVAKVVMTSSIAAIADGHGPQPANRIFTEQDWSNPKGPNISPYAQSKTIAERAAWDFVAKDKPGFAFATVNPGLVLGPVLSKDFGVSPEIVRRLMAGEVPGLPRLGWETVDVRDVASLHLLALNSAKADGQRFIASSEFVWMADMAEAIRKALPAHAKKVPVRKVPDFVLRIMALFDPAVRGVVRDLGRKVAASHKKAEDLLGWKPRSAREAAVATAESMVRHGVV
jgi:dihydroflavonol-4-reductase